MRNTHYLALLSLYLSSINATDPSIRTKCVQIVHRHGDRTPITPLKDEDFWAKQLIPETTLQAIAKNTDIIHGSNFNHVAGGRWPFGKLTELGLLQMIKVGNDLRERFPTLTAKDIKIYSTDFPRTIQSVQGLLTGLFPELPDETITIDARNTVWMIPDPQPRRTRAQAELENELSRRPYIVTKEQEMLPLAIRATKALHPLLSADAHEFAFGVSEELPGNESVEIEPLAWNQLAEITKCLAVRDMLPSDISKEDQEEISQHAAWKWFENLRDHRLALMGMGTMVNAQLQVFENANEKLTVWSAHDSTLIGLLCAYRLAQPSVWPEYASVFMMELLEVGEGNEVRRMVRFSLNDEVLKSELAEDGGDLVPLETLVEVLGSSDICETQ